VHIVDREGDSVRHLHQWSAQGCLWRIRVKATSRVSYLETTLKLSNVAAGLTFQQTCPVAYQNIQAIHDDMQGIAWQWQSIDEAICKAPLALEKVGPNPTDKGKKWKQAQFAGGRAWYPVITRRQRSQHA